MHRTAILTAFALVLMSGAAMADPCIGNGGCKGKLIDEPTAPTLPQATQRLACTSPGGCKGKLIDEPTADELPAQKKCGSGGGCMLPEPVHPLRLACNSPQGCKGR
jgi:hypothetical protein